VGIERRSNAVGINRTGNFPLFLRRLILIEGAFSLVSVPSPPTWQMEVAKSDLLRALRTARTRATLRRTKGAGVEHDITLTAAPGGLSVRSSFAAMDIPGDGAWPSPILAYAAGLKRVVPKLPGATVTLRYEAGRLYLGPVWMSAREA
jgi:hypothetical protein